jgi:hypothetical protein
VLAAPPTAHQPTYGSLSHRNGKLYLVGGLSSGGSELTNLSEYDIATNTWTELAPMSVARKYLATGWAGDWLVAAGGNDSIQLATVEVFGDAAPNPGDMLDVTLSTVDPTVSDTLEVIIDTRARDELNVKLDVGQPPESNLVVRFDTTSESFASDKLLVAMNTGHNPESALPVLLDVITPGGATQASMDGALLAGGEITGVTFDGADNPCAANQTNASIAEGFGRGRVGTIEVIGTADLTTVSSVTLRHTTVALDGTIKNHEMRVPVLPNPDGRGWRTENGKPVSSITSSNPMSVLSSTTITTELISIPNAMQNVVDGDIPQVYGLDDELGDYDSTSEDCAAYESLGVTFSSRLEVAKAAAAAAGFSLIRFGDAPNQHKPVDAEYKTLGKTAMSVIQELLYGGNPRTWATTDTLYVDSREIPAGATGAPTGFGEHCEIVKNESSFQDQAADDPGEEPILADYLEECEAKDSSTPPPEGSTFETFDDGAYSWWERSGQDEEYKDSLHNIIKKDGKVTRETISERGWARGFILDKSFDVLARTERYYRYHNTCPDALTSTVEHITHRKTDEDLRHLVSQIDDSEMITEEETFDRERITREYYEWLKASNNARAKGEPAPAFNSTYSNKYPRRSTEEQLWAAMPKYYTQKRTIVGQRWHAEGWLRSRKESTKEYDGIIAIRKEGTSSLDISYSVVILYKYTERTETYIPIGNGLWRISTNVRTSHQKPIYEPLNPDAEEGDEDYAVMEVTDSRSQRVSNTYTVITDQPPPSVSCPPKTCVELADERTCEEKATDRWEEDHAEWAARLQQARAKRVWSIRSKHLAPNFKVGNLVNGGIVANVTHEARDGQGGTTATVWQYRE